jgi:hypothetical protein
MEEQELMREQIKRELQAENGAVGPFIHIQSQSQKFKLDAKPRFKVKWSPSAVYDYDRLYKIFSRYGHVSELLILKKKALVEFVEQKDAVS